MTSRESPAIGRLADGTEAESADTQDTAIHNAEEVAIPARGRWSSDPVMRLATEHVVILLALVAFMILVIKVLIEVRGATESALAIVQGAGVAALLLSLAVSVMPAAAPAIATMGFLMAFDRGLQPVATVVGLRPVSAAVGVAATLVTIAITSVIGIGLFLAVVAVAYIGIVFVRRRDARQGKVRERAHRRSDRMLATSLGFVVGAILLVPGMWVPPERVTLADGTQSVAFVIGIGDGWATLLRESDRSIDRFKADAIAARKVCRLGKGRAPTLLQLAFDDPSAVSVPQCR
jgi:hypothetical protein